MNRRNFLKMLGVGIAAPKLIFDMGKNSRLYTNPLLFAHPRFKIPYMTHLDVPDDTIYFVNGSSIAWEARYDGYWIGPLYPNKQGLIYGLSDE